MLKHVLRVSLITVFIAGCTSHVPPLPPEVPFRNPAVIKSVDGVVDAELVAQYADNEIGGDPVSLRSYNGALVGPTLRLKPGETIKLRLGNRLPPNASHGAQDRK